MFERKCLISCYTRLSKILICEKELYVTYLGIYTDDSAAFLASIGEDGLVAGDAVRMFVPEDVPLSCKALVALPAAEVLAVPVLVHGLCVFSTENQL